ncbi:MAG: flagellar motor stator protein MotA [Melioribacteraceae bacterium]|jgi:chemotaxis protein MotA|nr:flagellar motor stator protein MotA [Melioribacteraceae bacterium]
MLFVGILVVLGAVVSGFILSGGDIHLLIQPYEVLVIVGVAIGSVLISTPLPMMKKLVSGVMGAIKGFHNSKQDYLELLKSFNELFLVAQRDGLLSIEAHIEHPKESTILSQNKKFVEDDFMTEFFCDSMKVMLTGSVPPHDLEELMDSEIETYEIESEPIAGTIATVGDAFPALGIVAAVLGIIITMGSINEGPAVVGHHVAAALVGTFLGVLLAYGIVGPISVKMHHDIEDKKRHLVTIKTAVLAYAKGNPPMIALEIARRTIFSDNRPSFGELENFLRGKSE